MAYPLLFQWLLSFGILFSLQSTNAPVKLTDASLLSLRVSEKARSVSLSQRVWNSDKTWCYYEIKEEMGERTDKENGVTYRTLCCMKKDGKRGYRIFKGKEGEYAACNAFWSPDGHYLFFWIEKAGSSSVNKDGIPLYIVSLKTGKAVKLTERILVSKRFLAFSRDNRFLAMTVGSGRFWQHEKRIAIWDIIKRQRRWLTPASMAAVHPTWSPDGKTIAYAALPSMDLEHSLKRHGSFFPIEADHYRHLYIIDKDGKHQQKITHDRRYREYAPRWLKDGRTIEFIRVHNQSDKGSVWQIDLKTQKLRRIHKTEDTPYGVGNEDWD